MNDRGRWADPPTAVLSPDVVRRICDFGLLDGNVPTPRHPEVGARIAVAFPTGGVIKFEWTDPNPLAKSAWYQLAIATDIRFEIGVRVYSVLDVTYFPTWLRANPDHYFWRVRVLRVDAEPGPWSRAVSFQVVHDPDLHAPRETDTGSRILKTVRKVITRVRRHKEE